MSMRYALFLGCKIPYFVPQYEIAARRILAELGVRLVDLEFNCCGYPMRHLYFSSFLLATARALALAEARGLEIVTLCKCCFGTFRRAQFLLKDNSRLLQEVNTELAKERLSYAGRCVVKHLQQVLYHDVGLEEIEKRVVRPFVELPAAALQGCHALRPSRITGFDDPYTPTLVDGLVAVTGATSLPWVGQLQCCGAPLRNRNDKISLAMISARLSEARRDGAEVMVIDCPHSQMQCDWAYGIKDPSRRGEFVTGTVHYPQLLGLAMGLSPRELALEMNNPDSRYLLSFLGPVKEAEEQSGS